MPKTQQGDWPVQAHPLVHWLISREPGVKNYLNAYIREEVSENKVDVAGPPRQEEIDKRNRGSGDNPVELPTITLNLFKVRVNIGVWGLKIEVSDEHIEELRRWQLRASIKQQEELNLQNQMEASGKPN